MSRGKNQSNVQRGKKNTEKLKWRSKNGHGNNPDFKGSWVHFGRAEAIAELSFVRYDILQRIPFYTITVPRIS